MGKTYAHLERFFDHWITTYMGLHTFENNELIVLGGQNIISSKISAVELTQMDFNRK